jgi:uncharacterized membrane protein YcaP (DUF421 family)
VRSAARQQGIRDLGNADLALLEADGKISFVLEEDKDGEGAPEMPEEG